MRAIDRTTFLFVCAVRDALPDSHIYVQRSNRPHGCSRYVFITLKPRTMPLKVRISDHAVGMRRATSGSECLYLNHLAKPDAWAIWLSRLAKRKGATAPSDLGPLFQKGVLMDKVIAP